MKNLSSYNKNSELKFFQNSTSLWAIGCDVSHNARQNFFIYDNVANATRFYVDSAGRIGIGTIPPTSWAATSIPYKLYVAGGIATRDVKVTAGSWPDYVLKKNYSLMPIQDLEEYISSENHLPGMPSAADIENDKGFEIGEMQTNLLKKIEELTLYILDQQKQMNEIKKELKEIKGK